MNHKLYIFFFLLLTGCSKFGFGVDQSGPYPANDEAASSTDQPSGFMNVPQPRKRVAVLELWNDTPFDANKKGEQWSQVATQLLRGGLQSSRRVIVDQGESNRLMTEEFVSGSEVKLSALIREGRRLGVHAIVIGRIRGLDYKISREDVGLLRKNQAYASSEVELKVFDVETGRELVNTSRSSSAEKGAFAEIQKEDAERLELRDESLEEVLGQAIDQLVPVAVTSLDRLNWSTLIARISGSQVFVSAGKGSGLVRGDVLRVMSPGDDIFDPKSGAYLGRTKGRLKGTLEVREFIGPDAAMALVHSGAGFKEGDIVQLY